MKSRLRGLALFAALLAVLVVPASAFAAAPANDGMLEAKRISRNPYTHSINTRGATLGSTDGVNEPRPCGAIGRTVWYRFDSGEDQDLTADTFGSNFDTIIAMYWSPGTAKNYDELEFIGCNDDAASTVQSRLKRRAHAGDTIYVQVGGYRKAGGSLAFHLRAKPANDLLPLAREITDLAFASTLNTRYATMTAGEPQPCGNLGRTVWFAFYVPADMTIYADTWGSNFDTVLAVYTASGPVGSFDELSYTTCNDDGASSVTSDVEFGAPAGTTAYFQIGGYSSDYGELSFYMTEW
jgi:hypothetical protein